MRVELLNKPTRGTVAANRGRGRCHNGKEAAGYSTKCDNKTSLIAAFQLKNMENGWGTRTRTRKGRTRICSVANYTIPQTKKVQPRCPLDYTCKFNDFSVIDQGLSHFFRGGRGIFMEINSSRSQRVVASFDLRHSPQCRDLG